MTNFVKSIKILLSTFYIIFRFRENTLAQEDQETNIEVADNLPLTVKKTDALFKISPKKYEKALQDNKNFYIQFSFFKNETETVYLKIINQFLEKHNVMIYKGMVLAILRELITNAIKANSKRLYFKLTNLDIKNIDDYKNGMKSFKKDVYGINSDFFDKLQNHNLYVKVKFESLEKNIRMKVINNTPILKDELKKIKERIKEAYSNTDISDAFDTVLDDSEGAGLGLIMAVMLFKNAGMPSDSFKIKSERGKTYAIITLPLKD